MFKEVQKHDHKYFIDPRVYASDSSVEGAGTGCFTKEDIPARTIVEVCPVILCHPDTYEYLNRLYEMRHILADYPFVWPNGMSAFALGWGGVYNHSFEPNLHWRFRTKEKDGYDALVFRTLRDIHSGEELFIKYVGDPDKLWFVDDSVDPLATSSAMTDFQMKKMNKSSIGIMLGGDPSYLDKKKSRNRKDTLGSLSTLGKKDDSQ